MLVNVSEIWMNNVKGAPFVEDLTDSFKKAISMNQDNDKDCQEQIVKALKDVAHHYGNDMNIAMHILCRDLRREIEMDRDKKRVTDITRYYGTPPRDQRLISMAHLHIQMIKKLRQYKNF